jgi:integrase
MARPLNPNTLRLVGDLYKTFYESLDSQATKDTYEYSLRKYMNWLQCKDGNVDQILNGGDSIKIQNQIINFLIHMRNGGNNLSQKTLKGYYTALKSFYEYNDVTSINWKKVRKTLGHMAKKSFDRDYTTEEIARLLQFADERKKVMILLMASSGMRRGAVASLKLCDLQLIPEHKLYQVIVYRNEPEEYITFCTPECAQAIDSYLQYRQRYGEKLTPYAPLIRERFNSRRAAGNRNQQPYLPPSRHLNIDTIDNEIYRLVYTVGIRDRARIKTIGSGERHETMVTHSLRKRFKNQCMSAEVNPIIAEMLLGHNVGLEKVYYRPTPANLLKEYLKAIPNLTINEEERLRLKLTEQQAKEEQQQLRFESVMKEREKLNQDALAAMSDQMMKMMQEIEKLKKK